MIGTADEDEDRHKIQHSGRKTYMEELEEKLKENSDMKNRKARKNPFADQTDFDLTEFDCELMRERAKIYMAKREWDRALKNLNRTLVQWGAKGPERYDFGFPPNKQVPIFRLQENPHCAVVCRPHPHSFRTVEKVHLYPYFFYKK